MPSATSLRHQTLGRHTAIRGMFSQFAIIICVFFLALVDISSSSSASASSATSLASSDELHDLDEDECVGEALGVSNNNCVDGSIKGKPIANNEEVMISKTANTIADGELLIDAGDDLQEHSTANSNFDTNDDDSIKGNNNNDDHTSMNDHNINISQQNSNLNHNNPGVIKSSSSIPTKKKNNKKQRGQHEHYRSKPNKKIIHEITKTNNRKNNNFLNRFNQIISQELLPRIPRQMMTSFQQHFKLPQLQFQFQPSNKKGKRGKQQNKIPLIAGVDMGRDGIKHDDVAVHHSKGASSLVDFHSSRRVGGWCHPSTDEESAENSISLTQSDSEINSNDVDDLPSSRTEGKDYDKSTNKKKQRSKNNDSNKLGFDDHIVDDVKPGTVVFVLPSGDFEMGTGESDSDHAIIPVEEGASEEFLDRESDAGISEGENPSTEFVTTGTRCLSQLGRHYDHDDRVVQYTILQREPHEMGNIDIHKKDFAYQPVVLSITDGMRDGAGYSNTLRRDRLHHLGHEIEARISPEEEAVEPSFTAGSAVIDKRKLHRHQAWNDYDDNDQQVSFRWWSWVSHLAQFVHSGGGDGTDDDDRGDYDRRHESYSHHYNHHRHQSTYQSNIYEEEGGHAFAGGSYGEVWKAHRRCPTTTKPQRTKEDGKDNATSTCDDGKELIAKRLKIEYGYSVLEAGLREVYFGELLAREVESSSLFTTYVDHFFRKGKDGNLELWIIFENAGPSLRSFLYTPVVDSTAGFVVFQNSPFWRRLRRGIAGGTSRANSDDDDDARKAVAIANNSQVQIPVPRKMQNRTLSKDKARSHSETGGSTTESEEDDEKEAEPEGRVLLREVLRQIIASVAFLHEHGIVHRDIKPSNIMCKTSPPLKDGAVPSTINSVQCLLGDFSSAWDEFSARNLYANGPSSAEQTDEYAPPEVLFQTASWSPFYSTNPSSFDSWSIGVVALEMLLGTPNVFSVDQRTTVLLTNRLRKEGASSEDIQRALYLAALSQFCIYVPTLEGKNWPLRRGDPLEKISVVKESCRLRDFHAALRARDPLGIGFDQTADTLLHLIWRLLAWDPESRISPKQALLHPYFNPTEHSGGGPSIDKLFQKSSYVDLLIPGSHNALESQTLDPKIDMNSSDTAISDFICPKCGKKFSDHNSCQQHARSRRHARFCTYDRSLLPHCLNAHSMLPTHQNSGYCDIQGRRRTIEDFHTVHLNEDYQFYGVFDGHMGNLASKYAASSFDREVEERLSGVDKIIKNSSSDWKKNVEVNLVQSFEDLHSGIVDALASSPGNVMEDAGTTATILVVTELAVIVANVGDSRAVLSHWTHDEKDRTSVTAMQLTIDHIASSPEEQAQIIEKGGFISKSGGIDRVNGSLAVSRSLGDVKLAPYLSRVPHVFAVTKEEVHKKCRKPTDDEESKSVRPNNAKSTPNNELPCFIILASDGLWDVMSNQEAVDLVVQVIGANKSGTEYQEAAEMLTQEAYVRGSLDNIGVCVVAIT